MSTQVYSSTAARIVTANNSRKANKEQEQVTANKKMYAPRKTIKTLGWRRTYSRMMEMFTSGGTLRLISIGAHTHALTPEAYKVFAAMRIALVRGYSEFCELYKQSIDKDGNIIETSKISEFLKLFPCYKMKRTGHALYDIGICPKIEMGAEYLRMTQRAYLPIIERKNILRAAKKAVWELYHFYAEYTYKDKYGRTKTATFPIIMHDDLHFAESDETQDEIDDQDAVLHELCVGLRFHEIYAQILIDNGKIIDIDDYFFHSSSAVTMALLEQLCERYTNAGAQLNPKSPNTILKVATILDNLPIPDEWEVLRGNQSRNHIIWQPLVNSLNELKTHGVIDYHFTTYDGKKTLTPEEVEQIPWEKRLPEYDNEKRKYKRLARGLRVVFSIPSLAKKVERIAKKAQQNKARAEKRKERVEKAQDEHLGKLKAKAQFKQEQKTQGESAPAK